MRNKISLRCGLGLTIAVICSSLLLVASGTPAQKAQKQPPSPSAKKQVPKPIKVLIRTTVDNEINMEAVPQFLFAFELDQAADKARPEIKARLNLTSAGPLLFVQDTKVKGTGEAAEKWEKDPAEYEFLIEWNIKRVGHMKSQVLDDLIFSATETWKVQKVSDPAVTKTWEVSYQLVDEVAPDATSIKTAVGQTEKVIVPARTPLFEEIRAFLIANQNAK